MFTLRARCLLYHELPYKVTVLAFSKCRDGMTVFYSSQKFIEKHKCKLTTPRKAN